MIKFFSIKSAAILCVATLAMCFSGQDANAQVYGRGFGGFSPGFGGTSINISRGGISLGYSNGFRGGSAYGYRPTYAAPVYRGGGVYGGGFYGGSYGRSYGGSKYASPRYRSYGSYGGRGGRGRGY